MKKISKGYTNDSYYDKGLFVQIKKYNGFNHKIDYALLSQFSFVPKLVSNDKEQIAWEWLGESTVEKTSENLKQIALQLKEIHSSKLPFPASNHAARVKNYIKIINEKKITIDAINKYYKHITKVLKYMDKTTPLHNDLWLFNMVEKDGKIYFIDWEYATKGDKHFDLAYFIESAQLNDEQESLFLDTYGDYVYEFVIQHKILVNYLIILWNNSQPQQYFDDKPFIKKLDVLIKELERYKQ
ncbi:Uncharacterised protein [Mesomycoplasma conjunctivae]|uniref:PTS SYSTEM, LICHENAN-SPECIFIC IIA COMPONENT n=1 Tax=Mesomycoplasma conjunctivae (strain ATCC 25834 / NCTC 10147 / HRC/581) TaxID=572263 RepID=C5J790_MESCH|nr:phosphotransferase [Mesomycoplasma conjunctivae]CAT05353.1 PTS SYSTEM, LICHENAN-SPECIFIC IIA COMPONENT [Mesomycoplasma conjunctivae]VEU66580.1 Uncharacterised protein [Mesomycoplasma conjunctivae]